MVYTRIYIDLYVYTYIFICTYINVLAKNLNSLFLTLAVAKFLPPIFKLNDSGFICFD